MCSFGISTKLSMINSYILLSNKYFIFYVIYFLYYFCLETQQCRTQYTQRYNESYIKIFANSFFDAKLTPLHQIKFIN